MRKFNMASSLRQHQMQTKDPMDSDQSSTESSKALADETGVDFAGSKKSKERRIDYVLVWEESPADTKDSLTPSEVLECRLVFEEDLRRAGIQISEETGVTSKRRIHFIKLFVSWDTMCHYAERLNIRVPVVPFTMTCNASSGDCYSGPCLRRPTCMTRTVPKKPPAMCTDRFSKANMSKYYGIKDKDHFFKPTQRHRVAYEILVTRVYGAVEKGEIGIDRLLKLGIYSSAYPLHEGPHALPDGKIGDDFNPEDLNPRQILHAYWASYGRWYEFQPLDHIREYFGEKIAFYFAFLGLYTTWLVLASLIGMLVFTWGCITLLFDLPSKEACTSGKAYKMCPKCKDDCDYWYLSDACIWLRLNHIFDHWPATRIYSIIISCWAVLFLEYWKRENAALAHRWSVSNLSIEEERPRPGYSLKCTDFKKNIITGTVEPYFPHRKRIPRFAVSIACLLVMLFAVFISILVTSAAEMRINDYLYRLTRFRSLLTLVPLGAIIAAVIQLIVLLILEIVYKFLADRLNEWEMHRTQSDWENNFILKMFFFQIFNYYGPISYVAYFKGTYGRQSKIQDDNNAPWFESCYEGGCMLDLAIQLGIVMTGKQMLKILVDIVWPAIRTKVHRFRRGLTEPSRETTDQWEADFKLIEYNRLQDDCLKTVLQFGFVTIFGAAFPLAPLFALINNLVEIRLDAWKLVCFTRRPLSERVQGIGVWLPLMQFIACVSVVSNALILGITSDYLHEKAFEQLYDSKLRGYLSASMPFVPDNTTSEPCRVSYRDISPKHYTEQLHAMNLAVSMRRFLDAFPAVVGIFFACYLLSGLVPKVQKSVLDSTRRQNYLVSNSLTGTIANQDPQQLLGAREEDDTPKPSYQRRRLSAGIPLHALDA